MAYQPTNSIFLILNQRTVLLIMAYKPNEPGYLVSGTRHCLCLHSLFFCYGTATQVNALNFSEPDSAWNCYCFKLMGFWNMFVVQCLWPVAVANVIVSKTVSCTKSMISLSFLLMPCDVFVYRQNLNRWFLGCELKLNMACSGVSISAPANGQKILPF